jgi:hypothetical protein
MSGNQNLSPSEMFLKYDYPETKDLCKQFLTLITTVLIISLTFSEKIVAFSSATNTSKWLIISSWISFLSAVIFCGLGLLFVTMAAGEAAYSRTKNYQRVRSAYKMIITAGGFFILGLILLIGTAIAATYNNNLLKDKQPPTPNGRSTIGITNFPFEPFS